MNRQQPDSLFKDKLQNYQKAAPAGAWQRIESSLEKKTERTFFWWKIAAALLLIAGAAYLFLFEDTVPETQTLAETKEIPHTTLPKEKTETTKSDNAVIKEDASAEKPQHAEALASVGKKPSVKRQKTEQVRTSPTDQELMVAVKETEVAPVIPELSSPTVAHKPASAPVKSTITLTISSQETDQYLNKNTLADATTDDKKPSTFKKFLKKANDLKSNQDPFGDLRERKNEILALNFRNDKREQNK